MLTTVTTQSDTDFSFLPDSGGVPINGTGVKQIRAEISRRLRAFEAMEPPDERAKRDALWPQSTQQQPKPPVFVVPRKQI